MAATESQRPTTTVWMVASSVVVLTTGVALYVLLLFLALGAGATWGGYGEAAREPTAEWFGPTVVAVVALSLISVVVAILLARRRLAWLVLPFVALTAAGLVGLVLSRRWPA